MCTYIHFISVPSVNYCYSCRSHFVVAHKAWEEHGSHSDMFIIIIDEIDAICKPRGVCVCVCVCVGMCVFVCACLYVYV